MANPELVSQAEEDIRRSRMSLIRVGHELIRRQIAGDLTGSGSYETHPDFRAAQEECAEAERRFSADLTE